MKKHSELFNKLPAIREIRIRELAGDEAFSKFANHYSHIQGSVVLLSGGKNKEEPGNDIIGLNPWMEIWAKGQTIHLKAGSFEHDFRGEPLALLEEIESHFEVNKIRGFREDYPVLQGGLLGYLAYEFKNNLEDLPQTTWDDLHLPDMLFYCPSIIISHNQKKKKTFKIELIVEGQGLTANRRFLKDNLEQTKFKRNSLSSYESRFISNTDKKKYIHDIERIKTYILAGDVYQVNYTHRFSGNFSADPYMLFRELYKKNPAEYFAYINGGDHHIISTSPECFLKRNHRYIESRPIKGTRPRGKTDAEDEAFVDDLLTSKKDDAELSMIVDLVRNDLGRICLPESIKVTAHKKLIRYANVSHLESTISGTLPNNFPSVSAIKAAFPAGSITGCPKIRAMEIIDELEINDRHIYTGSIGYISFHQTMVLSVAIRTATVCRGKIHFALGGGIVLDSIAEDEYRESLDKGNTFFSVLNKEKREKNMKAIQKYAWINGEIKDEEEISIPFNHLGVQYGFGFFETIRVENGHIFFINEHLNRFQKAWHNFVESPFPQLSWEEIITAILNKNNLLTKSVAIKILFQYGLKENSGNNHSVIISAHEYVARENMQNKRGLKLLTYPYHRETMLADYKTTNYLHYYLAGQWAKQQGADEALIVNGDGTLSETNTANLLLIRGKSILLPKSNYVLPGIMEEAICNYLQEKGYEKKQLFLEKEDISDSDEIYITNSLLGIVPAISIDDLELNSSWQFCKKINRKIFQV